MNAYHTLKNAVDSDEAVPRIRPLPGFGSREPPRDEYGPIDLAYENNKRNRANLLRTRNPNDRAAFEHYYTAARLPESWVHQPRPRP